MARDAGEARIDTTVLAATGIVSGYDKRDVLHEVSVAVSGGEVVTVLGHNGAGKTTLLRTLFGTVPLRSGRIEYLKQDVSAHDYVERVNQGITLAHAEAPVFRDLSVHENLDLGAFTIKDRNQRLERIGVAKDLFPVLGERSKQLAGTMSGGEQRMLSLAMAFIAGPKLMLLDEPSLGIAPALAEEIFKRIQSLAKQEDLSILMVEQNVRAALRITDRAYFMRNGEIVLEEAGAEALDRDSWWELF